VEHHQSEFTEEVSNLRRRTRQRDSLANRAAIRGVLGELKDSCPALSGFTDRRLSKLLQAIRHQVSYPATDTKRGRPTNFDRKVIEESGRRLKAILERETAGRISIRTFVGHYLPILEWPADVVTALECGDLSRLEAAHVARITADRLGLREREAMKIREEIISNHIRSQGSQTALREKTREALGELTLVTSERMVEAIEKVDDLLRIDPRDRRHLFYEQMKDFFFALREIQPDEIDDVTMDQLVLRADELMDVIHSIQWKRKQKEKQIRKFSL